MGYLEETVWTRWHACATSSLLRPVAAPGAVVATHNTELPR